MSGAEIPRPDLVAFINAVQDDLKNPRYLEHPNFGRMQLVPMPVPLASLWFGHSITFEATERAQRDMVVVTWLHGKLRKSKVEVLSMLGRQVIDGTRSPRPSQATHTMEQDALSHAKRVQCAVDTVRAALHHPSPEHSVQLARIVRDLRDVPPAVNSEGQLLALTGVCRYFQEPDHDSAQALEAAVLLGKRAIALGRPQERLSALMTQALIHDELDNHLEAVEAYGAARALARDIGLVRAEVASLVMAAQTLRHGGDPAGAEALASHALVVAEHTDEVDDLRAQAWVTIVQWHLCMEEGVEGLTAVENARRCLTGDADAGLCATLDYTEVLLRLLAGTAESLQPLLDSLDRHARRTRTIGAALSYTAARGAVDLVLGTSSASVRLVNALEKARCVPRALADVLMAALTARAVVGDEERAGQLRDELCSLFEARRSAGQLKATLMRGPVIGFGALGKAFDAGTYDRRLARAQELLLAGRAAS